MAVMEVARNGHAAPLRTRVRKGSGEYLVELELSDFTDGELSVQARGHVITVFADHVETDDDRELRLRERLEESFRLPDDADVGRIKVVYDHGTLDVQAPLVHLEPRELPIEHRSARVNPDATAV